MKSTRLWKPSDCSVGVVALSRGSTSSALLVELRCLSLPKGLCQLSCYLKVQCSRPADSPISFLLQFSLAASALVTSPTRRILLNQGYDFECRRLVLITPHQYSSGYHRWGPCSANQLRSPDSTNVHQPLRQHSLETRYKQRPSSSSLHPLLKCPQASQAMI
jgi:hypothetical protein